MASLDYVVGQPLKYSPSKMAHTIIALKIAIAEEKGLPEAEVEHEAYSRLADFYYKHTQEILTALEEIGAGVEEYLESNWLKGMNHIIAGLDNQAQTLHNKSN